MKKTFMQKLFLAAGGALVTLILVEAALRSGAWLFLSLQDLRNRELAGRQGAVTVLCLGESTTAGQYPRFLQKALDSGGGSTRFRVIDKGVPAINTDNIAASLPGYLDEYKPAVVVMMMGINDWDSYYVLGGSLVRAHRTLPERLKLYRLFRYVGQGLRARFGRVRGSRAEGAVVIDRQGPRPGDEASAEGNDLRRTGRYAEALYSYKKALDTPGYAGGARDDLYAMYMDLERLPDGKEVLADAVRLFPRDTTPLFSLAEWYMRNREPEAAEPLFRDYIRRDPGRMLGYAGLGGALLALHRDKEALEAYKAAVRTNPRQDKKLYDMYMDLESMPGGGEVLVDAVRVFSNDAMPLFSLAEWYLSHNKPDAAEPLFRDYIRREPDKLRGYTGLGKALLALGKKEEALEVFRAALKASPRQDNRFYGLLAVQYLRQKDFRNAERYFDKVTDWNLSYPNPATVRNYAAVIAELLRRKIVPLCMQYPLRSLRPLKELAGDQAAGVVFVDNEESFKRYLRGHDYDELFSDQFAGDFGHCTDRGNTMIAENLARTIRAALKAK